MVVYFHYTLSICIYVEPYCKALLYAGIIVVGICAVAILKSSDHVEEMHQRPEIGYPSPERSRRMYTGII